MNPTNERRTATMVVATVVVAVGLVLIPAGQASAGGPLACVAQGTAFTTATGTGPNGTIYTWQVSGDGTCLGDFKGPYKVEFFGRGTSAMLGLCDNLIVRDFNIPVRVTLTSRLNNQTRTFDEVWTAPLTVYPIATPFLIQDTSGGLLGGGALETRTRLQCAPAGAPTAVFNWVQLKS